MYKKYCLILLITIVSACKDQTETVVIELADHYDKKSVLVELKSNGANCNLIKQKLHCDSDDMELVNETIKDISLRESPAGSIYLGMPGLHEAVIEELKKRQIAFQIRLEKNEKWLIVGQENLEILHNIIDEKTHELRLAENQE